MAKEHESIFQYTFIGVIAIVAIVAIFTITSNGTAVSTQSTTDNLAGQGFFSEFFGTSSVQENDISTDLSSGDTSSEDSNNYATPDCDNPGGVPKDMNAYWIPQYGWSMNGCWYLSDDLVGEGQNPGEPQNIAFGPETQLYCQGYELINWKVTRIEPGARFYDCPWYDGPNANTATSGGTTSGGDGNDLDEVQDVPVRQLASFEPAASTNTYTEVPDSCFHITEEYYNSRVNANPGSDAFVISGGCWYISADWDLQGLELHVGAQPGITTNPPTELYCQNNYLLDTPLFHVAPNSDAYDCLLQSGPGNSSGNDTISFGNNTGGSTSLCSGTLTDCQAFASASNNFGCGSNAPSYCMTENFGPRDACVLDQSVFNSYSCDGFSETFCTQMQPYGCTWN